MLYAQCVYCRNVAPLVCTGVLMLHPAMPCVATPQGAACRWCGPMPPVYTCSACLRPQTLAGPTAGQGPAFPGVQPGVAPVAQAGPGSSGGKFGWLQAAGKGFGEGIMKGLTGGSNQGAGGQYW
jgi:hypothetical protein